jgi:leader peptidase (prepilin peptidase)/N-methyltransferase
MLDWLRMHLPTIVNTAFVFAFGACVGSLINVLVYRLPRGLDVVRPQSRCPKCGAGLTFRENIPILGWVLLGGRCRFCKEKISAEYPIVETFTAVLFAGVFLAWYGGVGPDWLRPEWARNGFGLSWPAFVVVVALMGCLIAATLIDARTFTIPIVLCWVPVGVALVLHVGHAAWMDLRHGPWAEAAPGIWRGATKRWVTAPGWVWTLATPGTRDLGAIGAGVLGAAGVVVSNILLRAGLITRSFADYAEWEAREIARKAAEGKADAPADQAAVHDVPASGSDTTTADGTAASGHADGGHEMWIQYPHARREMVKEAAFLAPIAAGMFAGWHAGPWLAARLGGGAVRDMATGALVGGAEAPLWLTVLAGVCLGYLVGGGVVWLVRLVGSLAFGKEAMGMGDVHLMASVGACLGWVNPVIAFFAAAFLGVGWEIARRVVGGRMNRALPYGPHLAAATVLVLLGRAGVEAGLGALLGRDVFLP